MIDDNHKVPETELINTDVQTRKPSVVGKWLAVVGSLLLLTLPLSFLSTLVSMINLFQNIAYFGTGDAKLMAGEIAMALVSVVQGLILCAPGALLLCLAITIFKYRTRWVYRVSLFAAWLTIIFFPIGTIVSIIILLWLKRAKYEFYQDHPNT
jgi:hypothetical protein